MLSRLQIEDLLRAATRSRTARDVLEHLRPSGPRPRLVPVRGYGLYFPESILRHRNDLEQEKQRRREAK